MVSRSLCHTSKTRILRFFIFSFITSQLFFSLCIFSSSTNVLFRSEVVQCYLIVTTSFHLNAQPLQKNTLYCIHSSNDLVAIIDSAYPYDSLSIYVMIHENYSTPVQKKLRHYVINKRMHKLQTIFNQKNN